MFVYHGSGHSNRISDFDPTVDKVQFQAGSAEELVNVFEAQGATVSISDFGGRSAGAIRWQQHQTGRRQRIVSDILGFSIPARDEYRHAGSQVLSEMATTTPTQHDRHFQRIAETGHGLSARILASGRR